MASTFRPDQSQVVPFIHAFRLTDSLPLSLHPSLSQLRSSSRCMRGRLASFARQSMSYLVRSARASDSSEIARLSGHLGYPAKSSEISSRLGLLLPNSSHLVLAAEPLNGKSLVGWIAVERRILLESGVKFEIVGLVVDSKLRCSGVGRALVQAAEQWVIAQSGSNLGVRSNVLRPESHGFYESLGYILKKSQHVYSKSLTA